jgi:hypothetical protein
MHLPRVFCSGSCRLLTSIGDGRGVVEPIHSMTRNFMGPNFLGKLHSVEQHIQFLEFLMHGKEIPRHVLSLFLTSYSPNARGRQCESLIPAKIDAIRSQFASCDAYIFEICSIKRYMYEGFHVQYEHDYGNVRETLAPSTKEELMASLHVLMGLIPEGKRVIFQCHMRPQVFMPGGAKPIEKREIIYETLVEFVSRVPNTYLVDPSTVLRDHFQEAYAKRDVDHFSGRGYELMFGCLQDVVTMPPPKLVTITVSPHGSHVDAVKRNRAFSLPLA